MAATAPRDAESAAQDPDLALVLSSKKNALNAQNQHKFAQNAFAQPAKTSHALLIFAQNVLLANCAMLALILLALKLSAHLALLKYALKFYQSTVTQLSAQKARLMLISTTNLF